MAIMTREKKLIFFAQTKEKNNNTISEVKGGALGKIVIIIIFADQL